MSTSDTIPDAEELRSFGSGIWSREVTNNTGAKWLENIEK